MNSKEYRENIHKLIPGGCHTYSKGDDQFPSNAPPAISRGMGAYVWDQDGNKFLDCSMGLSSVSLGHAYEPVLERVREELVRGVNFQRPSIIEGEMAEVFLDLVPMHDMIKFAKNGSTATSAAVKLARAYTGREYVAFPSDHPFYSYDDWFIGQTACPRGVPEAYRSLSLTYKSTDLSSLKQLFEQYPNQIACVISEPEKNFSSLFFDRDETIQYTQSKGALFIQDEMVTGFKTGFPGSIKNNKVAPDMATWGKGIANGFSFCALTGKKEIMNLGGILDKGKEKVFLISSTHGGETHAIAAGLATINEFKRHNVLAHNQSMGKKFSSSVNEVIKSAHLSKFIQVEECAWLPALVFKDTNGNISPELRTLVLQEMIKHGVLFQGAFVPCFSHGDKEIEIIQNALSETLKIYERALESGWENFLEGEACQPVFRRFL